MWKLRIGAFLTSGLLMLGISSGAQAASGGNANAGDVWVDTVGNVSQLTGPGHEMDPHLACLNINLWGSGLADGSGTFSIDGWPPSGSQEAVYSDNWTYNQSSGRKSANQIIAVIDVSKLISQAEAKGDTPAAQGFHFKLDFSQDPQKHKTFWVDCTASTSGGGGGNDGGGGGNNDGGGPGPTTTGGSGGSTTTPSTTSTPSRTTTPTTSIGAATSTRHAHKTHKRRHKRVHRHKLRPRHVKAERIRLPTFTG